MGLYKKSEHYPKSWFPGTIALPIFAPDGPIRPRLSIIPCTYMGVGLKRKRARPATRGVGQLNGYEMPDANNSFQTMTFSLWTCQRLGKYLRQSCKACHSRPAHLQ